VFDLGRVTIPVGDTLSTVKDTVLEDNVYKQTVRSASLDAVDLRATRAQEQMTRQAAEGVLDQQHAKETAKDLAPGHPLSVKLTSPASDSINIGRAAVNVRIEGGNRTFVEPTLGVPRRVSLILNGVEHDYKAAHWTSDAAGLSYVARIIPVPPPASADPRPSSRREQVLETVELTRTTGVTATVSADGERVTFAAERGAASDRLARAQPRPLGVADASRLLGGPVRLARALDDAERLTGQPITETPIPIRGVGSATLSAEAHPPTEPRPAPSRRPIEVLAEVPAAVDHSPDGRPIIPGRPGMNVLQVAVSDGKMQTNTKSESVVFFLKPGLPEVPEIVLDRIDYDPPGPDPLGEHVLIRSNELTSVDMTGWTLRDLAQHVYRFPAFELAPGETVRVWTGLGTPDSANLYWGRRAAVWNNIGDTAVLSNERGQEVARLRYEG